jgi:hypothetical protein
MQSFWPFCVASAPPNLPEPPLSELYSEADRMRSKRDRSGAVESPRRLLGDARQPFLAGDETADLDDGVEVFDS